MTQNRNVEETRKSNGQEDGLDLMNHRTDTTTITAVDPSATSQATAVDPSSTATAVVDTSICMSSLDELTLLELEHTFTPPRGERKEIHSINVVEVQPTEQTILPESTLVIVAETEKLQSTTDCDNTTNTDAPFVSTIHNMDFPNFPSKFKWLDWDRKTYYGDLVKEGLIYNNNYDPNAKYIMLYETPHLDSPEAKFHNKEKFKFHDWPPEKCMKNKNVLAPCRYSLMTGPTFPIFLTDGVPPPGLMDHWRDVLPHIPMPHFVDMVQENDIVYAYLPVEQIKNHVNDPETHYHLVGKNSIHLMTQKTTRLLPDTRSCRPCVVKTTHSMGSKGIFIIENDKDEKDFEDFLETSGNPPFVITDFVDIHRNVACHFFMHPSGSITWFGSNENKRLPNGSFTMDSYLEIADQDELKKLQAPFVEEVVQYCKTLGFWGFCGVDVLFDSEGRGYLVDINPRVTGTCPSLMTLNVFNHQYGFTVGLFRRNGNINFYGTNEELVRQVTEYNNEHEGKSKIVLHSFYETEEGNSRLTIGVYGFDMDDCKTILNRFALPAV
jgi:ATP-grasp domain